jgi:hypothetical protein
MYMQLKINSFNSLDTIDSDICPSTDSTEPLIDMLCLIVDGLTSLVSLLESFECHRSFYGLCFLAPEIDIRVLSIVDRNNLFKGLSPGLTWVFDLTLVSC